MFIYIQQNKNRLPGITLQLHQKEFLRQYTSNHDIQFQQKNNDIAKTLRTCQGQAYNNNVVVDYVIMKY